MYIRQLNNSEYSEAIALSLDVFMECGTSDFDAKGLETFKSFIYNKELMNELSIFGAFDNHALIGVIGTKHSRSHISLFFINANYHHKGIGKKLFDYVYADRPVERITVNSSSYAIGFYAHLGFTKIAEEQETNGLKYTPMIRTINKTAL